MSASIKLSICIPTLNRARYIGETLESICGQLDERCELVIVDGGSKDNTEQIVSDFASRFSSLRYLKSASGADTASNEGFDRDCNQAVEAARGCYCWLMTDDDLLCDGAVASVLALLPREPDLVFTCVRVCDVDLKQTLEPALPRIEADKEYGRGDWAAFVSELGPQLTFVGGLIIKRSLWMARERRAYFGSGFVHVGVILSQPMDKVIALASPLVIVRYGNAQWRGRAFDIWMVHWPRLIWSFDSLPDATKARVTDRLPYLGLRKLLWYRALGAYTLDQYRLRLSSEAGFTFRAAAQLVARMPVTLSNALCSLYIAPRTARPFAMQLYDLLHCGHAGFLTRRIAQLRGIH
jgi:glycosyltransferase involved in cell wall biosynthesis